MVRICNRCVMDTTASNIVFDDNGICNFCKDFEKTFSTINHETKKTYRLWFRRTIITIFIKNFKNI